MFRDLIIQSHGFPDQSGSAGFGEHKFLAVASLLDGGYILSPT